MWRVMKSTQTRRPPPASRVYHTVNTADSLPLHRKVRPLSDKKLTAAKAVFAEMEVAGVICRSNSPWSSPLHMVRHQARRTMFTRHVQFLSPFSASTSSHCMPHNDSLNTMKLELKVTKKMLMFIIVLKNLLTNATLLVHSIRNAVLSITTDASNLAIGGILTASPWPSPAPRLLQQEG